MTFFHFMSMFLIFLVSHSSTADLVGSSCLRISPTKFLESAKQVQTILEQTHYTLSTFNDIRDCLDLLDMSSEQLRISMSAVQNPKGKDKLGTGNLSSDLRTWLSVVLTNSDTCIEGLEEGTTMKGLASKELNHVMYLVKTLLAQVKKGQFPSWITEEDKMPLRENFRVRTPDAVVATDGSGHMSY